MFSVLGAVPITGLIVQLLPCDFLTYVCQLYDDAEGQLYQFSYRLAGNLIKEAKADAAFFSEHIGHCCHETYPYGAPDFPEPHFDIEFFLTLPWVLDEADK